MSEKRKLNRKTYAQNINDGYLRLAEAILSLQRRSYEAALDNLASQHRSQDDYSRDYRTVQRIERELISVYYARLTMEKIDLRRYINDMRQRRGIAPRKWKEQK